MAMQCWAADPDGNGAHASNYLGINFTNPFTNCVVRKATADRKGILFSTLQTNSILSNITVDTRARESVFAGQYRYFPRRATFDDQKTSRSTMTDSSFPGTNNGECMPT